MPLTAQQQVVRFAELVSEAVYASLGGPAGPWKTLSDEAYAWLEGKQTQAPESVRARVISAFELRFSKVDQDLSDFAPATLSSGEPPITVTDLGAQPDVLAHAVSQNDPDATYESEAAALVRDHVRRAVTVAGDARVSDAGDAAGGGRLAGDRGAAQRGEADLDEPADVRLARIHELGLICH